MRRLGDMTAPVTGQIAYVKNSDRRCASDQRSGFIRRKALVGSRCDIGHGLFRGGLGLHARGKSNAKRKSLENIGQLAERRNFCLRICGLCDSGKFASCGRRILSPENPSTAGLPKIDEEFVTAISVQQNERAEPTTSPLLPF